ncbi:aminopeptidase P family protein [Candidatus Woesebacteria bacterium]|nr:aminopeptidase P family protein [Candidatus Woesebacteria bacterium]
MSNKRDQHGLRRSRLLSLLPSQSAVLLTRATDIDYFFGFSEFLEPTEREALAYFDESRTILFIPPLTVSPSIPAITIVGDSSEASLLSHIKNPNVLSRVETLFVDMRSLLATEYLALTKSYEKPIQALDRNVIWKLRMIKEESEQTAIRRACEISETSFNQLVPKLKAGITEMQVADLLEDMMKNNGSRKLAFPTIVAFGSHTALPHYQPGQLKLIQEMPILIDFGATWRGYRADMTRTIWFGDHPDPEFLKIERAVQAAYKKAFELVEQRPKLLTASQIDAAARGVIEKAGYGSQFIHTTGHGLGLDIHEPPSLNSRNQQLIEKNMAITIEPGIYLPDKFGYRLEDTIVVT